MNVLIISSANENINNYYKDIANKISSFLAQNNCDLIFGSSSKSMMGECYKSFIKNKRKVYAFTNEEYAECLKDLSDAEHCVVTTTFDLKKVMYQKADCIICLAGGIGTLSELLAFIEENRSNNKKIPIIIYDETEYYDYLLIQLGKMNEFGFVNNNIFSSFKLISNFEKFQNEFHKIKESVKNE